MMRLCPVLLLLLYPVAAQAFDVRVTVKRVDAEGARLTFTAPDGMERTARVDPAARFLDAGGKELASGLKSPELKEGATATLTVEREGNQPVVKALRLGTANPAAAKGKAAGKAAPPTEPLPKLDTSALVALTDMRPDETYHGKQGGLYSGGSNTRPASHTKAGIELARQ